MPLNPDTTLQPHQMRLRREAEEAAASGQPFRKLIFHGVGSGKTLSALAAADALGSIRQNTTIVGPAALRPTIRNEADKFFGEKNVPVQSYQAAAKGNVAPRQTFIADEIQRATTPGSLQSTATQDLADQSKNVILLSGTPTRNRPNELAPIISMLTGKHMSHDEFDHRFVGTERHRPGGLYGWLKGEPTIETPTLTNTDELKALLAGKVDYYHPDKLPVGVKHEDVEVDMRPEQAKLYEGLMGRLPYITRFKLKYSYGLSDDEMARARSFLTGPRQVALSDMPYRSDNDPYKAFQGSGKLNKAFDNLKAKLQDPRTKAIVYSNFLRAGLEPYAAALKKEKIPHAIFHGGLSDEERRKLVDGFNNNELKVALVGPAGAEGISLKGAQLVQLLDNAWNESRMRQAQARGIRYDSHFGLPEDLQNVTVQRYVAKMPLGLKDKLLERLGFDRSRQRAAVDDYLRNISGKKEILNKQLTDLLKEVGTKNHSAKQAAELASTLTDEELDKLFDVAGSCGYPTIEKQAISLRLANRALDKSLATHSPERAARFANRYGLWANSLPGRAARNLPQLGSPIPPTELALGLNAAGRSVVGQKYIPPVGVSTVKSPANANYDPRGRYVTTTLNPGVALHEFGHHADNVLTGRLLTQSARTPRGLTLAEIMANRRGSQMAGSLPGVNSTGYLNWVRRSAQKDAYRSDELLQAAAGERGPYSAATSRWLRPFNVRPDGPELLKRIASPMRILRPGTEWLKKTSAVTYVPRQALEAVRKFGLLSSKNLLENPEVLELAAKARGENPERFRKDIEERLKGWKPESSLGPNVMFKAPPKNVYQKLPLHHPLHRMDLERIGVDLDKILRDMPGTRVHGQELEPLATYNKRWTPEQLKADKDDPSFRHHDLTSDEISRYQKTHANSLWKTYDKNDGGVRYAPDVPHAAVITPTGTIPPEYLKFPKFAYMISIDEVMEAGRKARGESSPTVEQLRQAKRYSDEGNYDAKTDIVRGLVAQSPQEWFVDSHGPGPNIVGLTHRNSGFRIHLPRHKIVDLLPEADPHYVPPQPVVA